MSFILESSKGESLNINAWNWHPIVELLRRNKILSPEILEFMKFNGSGLKISAEQALAITSFLEQYFQTLLPTTKRILHDLSETDTIDDGTFYREEKDLVKNYSTSIETLKEFYNFCQKSGGFDFF